MNLKWKKPSVLRCCFWFCALIIDKENIPLYYQEQISVLGFGKGGEEIYKLVNDYYYCQKQSKSVWKSKIVGGRFQNVIKGKSNNLAWGRWSNSRPLPHGEAWRAGKITISEQLVYYFGWNPGGQGEHLTIQLLWATAQLLVTCF